MRTWLVLVLLLVLIPALTVAATAESSWVPVNPGLGNIQQIVPDRAHPGLWYAVNSGVLYRSQDAGRAWRSTGLTQLPTDRFDYGSGLSISPSTSEVFVITNAGRHQRLWASTDLGRTFRVRSSDSRLWRVIPSPANPNWLMAFSSTPYGLSSSSDGGRRWTEMQTLPYKVEQPFPGYSGQCRTSGYEFRDMVFSPFAPQTVYAYADVEVSCPGETTVESAPLVSTNGGMSWKIAEPSLYNFYGDAAAPSLIIGTNHEALYRLTRHGWSLLSHQDVRDITPVPSDPEHLFGRKFDFGPNPPFLRSNDGGKNWTEFHFGLGDIQHLVFDYNGGALAGTSGSGVFRRPPGNGWIASNAGFEEADVQDTTLSPDGTLYMTAGDEYHRSGYLYGSPDQGRSWRKLWSGSVLKSPHISINPRNPGILVLNGGDLFISLDSGRSWHRAHIAERWITSVAFDPSNRHRIYAVADYAYRSDDEGRTFQRLPLNFEGSEEKKVFVDPNDSRVLYFLVPYYGIFRSSDGGQTMEARNAGLGKYCPGCSYEYTTDLAPLAARDSFLLLTNRGPLYRTLDAGAHWQQLAGKRGQRIYPADDSGRRLYVFSGSDLFFSEDAGSTWTNLTSGLDAKYLRTSTTDPTLLPLYVGTHSGLFTKNAAVRN